MTILLKAAKTRAAGEKSPRALKYRCKHRNIVQNTVASAKNRRLNVKFAQGGKAHAISDNVR